MKAEPSAYAQGQTQWPESSATPNNTPASTATDPLPPVNPSRTWKWGIRAALILVSGLGLVGLLHGLRFRAEKASNMLIINGLALLVAPTAFACLGAAAQRRNAFI
jgi:hypothetical protein